MKEEWSDFLVYNDNLKGEIYYTGHNGLREYFEGDGWLRFCDETFTICSSEMSKTRGEIIKDHELHKDDKIVWVKDLPKDILSEYQKQIEEL